MIQFFKQLLCSHEWTVVNPTPESSYRYCDCGKVQIRALPLHDYVNADWDILLTITDEFLDYVKQIYNPMESDSDRHRYDMLMVSRVGALPEWVQKRSRHYITYKMSKARIDICR